MWDLAEAHYLALRYLEQGGKSDFFNLGNERGASVLEVAEAVKQVTGKEFPVICGGRRPGDPAVLVGSSRKAREILGWEPKYPQIETIVQHAWNWQEHGEF